MLRSALMLLVLASCTDDPRTPVEIFEAANEPATCGFGVWPRPGFPGQFVERCGIACTEKTEPQPSTPPGAICSFNGQATSHVTEFDGVIGACGYGEDTQGYVVTWVPCYCADNPEKIPPCD